ncbi:MAG: hypothetical protein PWQ55_2109 [Chloroflexota bacterium]|nr:hypothetical protein [Chloroflexota bacterium]
MAELSINAQDVSGDLLAFAQELVRIQSYSGQEEAVARAIAAKMEALGYDEVRIDSCGSVLGRVGSGPTSLLFESHTDTVSVNDAEQWTHAPFGGEIADGCLWGRGSVDMKGALAASVYAPIIAQSRGALDGKTVYVSCSVFEEDCDGEATKNLLDEFELHPDFAVICEPSGNTIAIGHKGKAQVVIQTHGVSAHGSAPEKGVNAVYAMAGIIQRVEQTNLNLPVIDGKKGTLVLSRISSKAVSLNAVPDECEIYLDRRLVMGEDEDSLRAEIEAIIGSQDASWEIDTIRRTAWTGKPITYRPLHAAWKIPLDHHLTQTLVQAYQQVFGSTTQDFTFWDFGTNAVALVSRDIPCIGFGPGDSKLAHMRDEKCPVDQIVDACAFYTRIVENI